MSIAIIIPAYKESDNIEKSMIKHLFENLEINEAPNEVYERLLLK